MISTDLVATLVLGIAAIIVAILIYRWQRENKRLEYLVVNNQRVVPEELNAFLKVSYKDKSVINATVITLRVLNAGNKEITKDDFETPLTIKFLGASHIVSALTTQTRPSSLSPALNLKDNEIIMKPLLINKGELIELQLLTSGRAHEVVIDGRISGLKIIERKDFPYPPGSGKEGELLGFDKFMWYFFGPVPLSIIALFIMITNPSAFSGFVTALIATLLLIYIIFINPWLIRRLIDRRKQWTP